MNFSFDVEMNLHTNSSRMVPFVAGLVLGTLLLSGCDTSVEPFTENGEYHYSVFGILNPPQDTQWVRVEPIAPTTAEGVSSDLDVTVTLENLDTGQEWTLRDSLMEVFRDEFQHNFWTEAPIDASTSYRLTVRGPGEKRTRATTTTPTGPPTISIEDPIVLPCVTPQEANRFQIQLTDVEELASLQVHYFQSVFGPKEIFRLDHYEDARQTNRGYSAFVNYFEDLQTARQLPESSCMADSAKVVAAAGGPDWPAWAQYQEATLPQLARPDSFTNVEGGHGLLSGVHTDTVEVPVNER